MLHHTKGGIAACAPSIVILHHRKNVVLSQQHPFRLKLLTVLSPHKNVYLLLVHSTTSLSRHDKTCFTRLRFE